LVADLTVASQRDESTTSEPSGFHFHRTALGSFLDYDVDDPNYGHRSRDEFWDIVAGSLDRLGKRVSAEERKKIESAIAPKGQAPHAASRLDPKLHRQVQVEQPLRNRAQSILVRLATS
jgi:hypothetical protein